MYNCVFTPKALGNILLHAICWTIRIQINNYNFFFIFCKTLAHPSIICKIDYILITWINVTIKKVTFKESLPAIKWSLNFVKSLLPTPREHTITISQSNLQNQLPNSVYMQYCTPGIILLRLISSRHDFFFLCTIFFLCFCIC